MELHAHGQIASKSISHRLNQLKDKWKKLNDTADIRKTRLADAVQYQQVSVKMLSGMISVEMHISLKFYPIHNL